MAIGRYEFVERWEGRPMRQAEGTLPRGDSAATGLSRARRRAGETALTFIPWKPVVIRSFECLKRREATNSKECE